MELLKILFFLIILLSNSVFSQEKSVNVFKVKYLNWYNGNLKDDHVLGANVDKAYEKLLANKKVRKTIVVAVIDGGVDVYHEDLQGKIWINEDEIPGNNIDDDNNGYIDDVNGWNFIGNSKGENILGENVEYTRILKVGNKDKDYAKAKKLYDEDLAKRKKEKDMLDKFEEKYNNSKKIISDKLGIDVKKAEDLINKSSDDKTVQDAIDFLYEKYKLGFDEEAFLQRKKRNAVYLETYLNLDFDPRVLVGDNPEDINDIHYGNNDVKAGNASHGTCVAGIIAGIRGNSIGVDGVATDVKIMVLRTTPKGDERDKDVALAIKYAVENGADIINMSFGKDLSPQQIFVEDAIKLAEEKNVLIVHAAGNSADNIDENVHYPSDTYLNGIEATNFINVGSSGMENDKAFASIFSNYGLQHVDIFAPGEDIVSLDTNNTYNIVSGTSQAAPVVTGVAALILSYYPELTPKEIIALLLETSSDLGKQKVLKPDLKNKERETVKFNSLSKSGGIVNAYEAIKKMEVVK